MDSSVSPTHGEQEMSVWNGHYECTCYHPLFVFNQFGDLERCSLRPGNVHSADGWDAVLKPVVARYQCKVSRIYFRADAGFANPEVYEFLEAERIKYAIRLPANQILQARIGGLSRPAGRQAAGRAIGVKTGVRAAAKIAISRQVHPIARTLAQALAASRLFDLSRPHH
jgi:Transposase DDE domain group 1